MGWTDSHLHQFHVGQKRIGPPSLQSDFDPDPNFLSEKLNTIEELTSGGSDNFFYEYDMGDSWIHEVIIEGRPVLKKKGAVYPRCIDGAGACPPEDSGGVAGYLDMLEVLKDPKGEEYEEIKDWLDAMGFEGPENFSIAKTNKNLQKVSGMRRSRK